MLMIETKTNHINTGTKSKFVSPAPDGRFKVNKAAIIKTLAKAQRQREKLEKLAAGEEDFGVIATSEHDVLDESRSLVRYTADDMLNLHED